MAAAMIRATVLLATLVSPATAEVPALVQPLIDYHAQACQAQGGTLTVGPKAVVPVHFFGPEDPALMLDSRQLGCSTSQTLFCAEGIGCELTLFVGTARHGLIALDWALVPDDDRQLLQVTIAGELLNKPEAQTFLATWNIDTGSLQMLD